MTTKDYVYLGLFVLASLVCYCHGFYAGVSRSARVYDALLKDENEQSEAVVIEPDLDEGHSASSLAPGSSRIQNQNSFPLFPRRELRSDFGNN